MASQQRFEGRELEELLDRVRNEVGDDAQIVAANRVRRGGIGGFFAREGFEVIVESGPNPAEGLEDIAELAAPNRRRRVPASVLDLAAEVSDHEQDDFYATRSMPAVDEQVMGGTGTTRPTIDLADGPTVSTETPDFASMLARLRREIDEEEAGLPSPIPSVVSDEPEPAPGPVFGIGTGLAVNDAPVSPRSHYRTFTPAITEPTTVPAAAADPRLLALGLPEMYTPLTWDDSDLRTALCQQLAQLPPPPMLPNAAGMLVAVVGIGTAPIALARRIGDELEVDEEHIIIATPEQRGDLSHPEEADALRRSCRRRSEPTVVACSIGPGRAELAWAHRMLDRLEPTMTWAVVEASCRNEDIAHRVELLGGIDVLALTGMADTVMPAAVLDLGIPVGRIGAKPATPAAWADLLIDRLER